MRRFVPISDCYGVGRNDFGRVFSCVVLSLPPVPSALNRSVMTKRRICSFQKQKSLGFPRLFLPRENKRRRSLRKNGLLSSRRKTQQGKIRLQTTPRLTLHWQRYVPQDETSLETIRHAFSAWLICYNLQILGSGSSIIVDVATQTATEEERDQVRLNQDLELFRTPSKSVLYRCSAVDPE